MSVAHPRFVAPSPLWSSQRGAGIIEFAIVALPILLVGLGSVELSHWLYTRQAISLALLEAGRAAITSHNRPQRITMAFEHALRPLYATPSAGATTHRLKRALAERQQRTHAAPWQIELLSPSASAFSDFANHNLRIAGAPGRPTINNDYLSEQDAHYRARGWADGRGPTSGQTIFEANTSVLRLSWLHEPRLPLIKPLLRALGDSSGTYRQRALANGYLPMTRQITLMMQSHPVQWDDSPDGKVLYRPEGRAGSDVCSGWLCGDAAPFAAAPDVKPLPALDVTSPGGSGTPGSGADNAGGHGDGYGSSGANEGNDGLHPDLVVDLDDPACGVTLCCV